MNSEKSKKESKNELRKKTFEKKVNENLRKKVYQQ